MIKYSPEHMHCLATVWGPLAPPSTGAPTPRTPPLRGGCLAARSACQLPRLLLPSRAC